MKAISILIILVGVACIFGYYSHQNSKKPAVLTSENKASDKITFVVFGDCAISKKPFFNEKIIKLIIEGTNSFNPDFVMFLGDGTNRANPYDISNLKNVFNQINCPLYVTIGNHDIIRGNNEGMKMGNGENNFFKIFSDNMTSPNQECYYSFAFNDTYFIVLNTAWQESKNTLEHKLKPESEQWKWLIKQLELAQKDYTNTIIFTHIPPVAWKDPVERQEFYKLMNQYKVTAVFSGHIHCYYSSVINSTKYVISGGAGSNPHIPKEFGGFYHFIVCTVSNGELYMDLHKITE
jgi:predicted MPP superfamily phosphohydrolase